MCAMPLRLIPTILQPDFTPGIDEDGGVVKPPLVPPAVAYVWRRSYIVCFAQRANQPPTLGLVLPLPQL